MQKKNVLACEICLKIIESFVLAKFGVQNFFHDLLLHLQETKVFYYNFY